MFKLASIAAIAAVFVAGTALPSYANAQTVGQTTTGSQSGSMTTMPVLYDAAGTPVNTGTGTLPAGYYYLQPGGQASQQVYYYGNGTYYNATTGEYGGSVNNPTGAAGFNYGQTGTSQTGTFVPGVPATGMGGQALATWITLLMSAAIVLAGGAYLAMSRRQSAGR